MKDGTIDITDLVEKMRSTFVSIEAEAIYLYAASQLPFLRLPIISTLARKAIEAVLTSASERVVMQAFFMNTAIRKASQARDYIDAIVAKESLPPEVSDEEYEKYEQREMAAFNSFVRVTG